MSVKRKYFAGILIEKKNKATVPVESLQNFDPENFNPRKLYHVKYNGELKKCLVLGVRGSKSAVETEIFSRRHSAPPANLIESASEVSEPDLSTKSGNKKKENIKKGTRENKNTLANKALLNQIEELKKASQKRQATDNNDNKIPSKFLKVKKDNEKTFAPQTLQHPLEISTVEEKTKPQIRTNEMLERPGLLLPIDDFGDEEKKSY
ncbi:uncharacterized protein LOC141527439 [Cotesia typhae]|uniref:uncharacterized protein LOC141527439 n=1 Tax=Cotesia typhae TaxID=2053667 RepID=UPI003D691F1E